MPSLSLANITWSTPDGRELLSGISVDFTRERVGLIGRNGVGKSTLIRVLSGEIQPTAGRVDRSGTIGPMPQVVNVPVGEAVADLLGISDAIALLRRAEAGNLAASQRRMVELNRRIQQSVERKQRRDGAGSRKSARGDMPRILAGARRDRAEKSGGGNARLAERQRAAGEEALNHARERVERVEKLAVTVAPTALADSPKVLDLQKVTFGYGVSEPILRDFSLSISGPDRVAVAGANGSGKSTLLSIMPVG